MAKPPFNRALPPPRATNASRPSSDDDSSVYRAATLFKDTCTPQRLVFKKAKGNEAPPSSVTTIRLLPEAAVDPADPDNEEYAGMFQPARVYDDSGKPVFTGWLEQFMVAKIPGGEGRQTIRYILFDPAADPGATKWDTPHVVLLKALRAAEDMDGFPGYWRKLISDKNRDKLGWPQPNYFAYGLVYHQDHSKAAFDVPLGLSPREKPPVIDLGGHSGKQIEAILRQPAREFADLFADEYAAYPSDEYPDANDLFAIKAPFDLDGGVFFRCFPKESKDPRDAEDRDPLLRRKNGKPPWRFALPPRAKEAKGDFGYEVYASKAFVDPSGKVRTPAIDPKHHEQLWRRTRTPLRDHLVFTTYDEQVALYARHLRQPDTDLHCPDLLDHAFGENDEWTYVARNALKGVVTKRKTVDLGDRDDRRAVRDGLAPRGRSEPEDDEEERPATRRRAAEPEDEEDEEDEAQPVAARPRPKPPATKGNKVAAGVPKPAPDDDDDEPPAPRRGKPAPVAEDDDEEDLAAGLYDDEVPAPEVKKSKVALVAEDDDETEDEDDETEDEDDEAEADDDDEMEADDEVATPPPPPSKAATVQRAKPISRDRAEPIAEAPARKKAKAELDFPRPGNAVLDKLKGDVVGKPKK